MKRLRSNPAAQKMFETRSQSWLDAGLPLDEVDEQAVRRARWRALVYLVLIAAVLVVADNRDSIFGLAKGTFPYTCVQWAIVVALLILGWALAAEVGRAIGPSLFRRMDPATAGTVGFFARLAVLVVVLFVALEQAGIDTTSLTIGASFLAIIFGLAAQQTLGNVFAGVVLLSARPFRVGERVRLQAGGVGGRIEGVVSSLGLLYTAFASGEDLTMVPNSVVLNSAVIPLREPDSIDLRARLRAGVTPRQLQRLLEESIETPLRDTPRIALEELDGDEVVVRITATPRHAVDGPALATEVLQVVSGVTRPTDEADASDGEPARPGRASAGPARGDGTARTGLDAPVAVRATSTAADEAPTAVRPPAGDGGPESGELDDAAPTAVRPPAGDRGDRA